MCNVSKTRLTWPTPKSDGKRSANSLELTKKAEVSGNQAWVGHESDSTHFFAQLKLLPKGIVFSLIADK